MPSAAVPLALSGISALAGLFGNKNDSNRSTINQTTNNQASSSSTPQLDWETNDLKRALIARYKDSILRSDSGEDLSGYEAQGLNTINRSSDLRTNSIRNSLAARGLSYSPIAALAPAFSDAARYSDTGSFRASLPLLQRQLREKTLSEAGSFFSRIPYGSSSQVDSSQHTDANNTGVQQGNPVGGGLEGLAASLGGLYFGGAFGGQKPQYGTNSTFPIGGR